MRLFWRVLCPLSALFLAQPTLATNATNGRNLEFPAAHHVALSTNIVQGKIERFVFRSVDRYSGRFGTIVDPALTQGSKRILEAQVRVVSVVHHSVGTPEIKAGELVRLWAHVLPGAQSGLVGEKRVFFLQYRPLRHQNNQWVGYHAPTDELHDVPLPTVLQIRADSRFYFP